MVQSSETALYHDLVHPQSLAWELGGRSAAHAVTCYESLDAVPADTFALIAHRVQDNFFLCAEWYRCLAEYGSPADLKPRIYVANNAIGIPECFLFCAADERGGTLRGLSNFYTMEFSTNFIGDIEPESLALRRLARHIAEERPRWRRVLIPFLRADRQTTDLLADAFAAEGFLINRYFQFENWYCDTDGTDFDTYYRQRPSQLRNTIKRKEKKVRREHDISIEIHENVTDRLISHWNAIYANSWKEKERFPRFMSGFMRTCAALGILRLGVLYFDGAPAAAQVWITSGRRSIIYKLAYDETYAKWSVGSILTRDMMRRALDRDGVAEIDYGVGSEAYKQDWMTGCRHVVGIEGFNLKSPPGLCLAGKWLLAITAKPLLRLVKRRGA